MKRVPPHASEPPPAPDRIGSDPESLARFLAALDSAIDRRVSEQAAGLERLAAAVEAVAARVDGAGGLRERGT